jgi:ketosteroid isomerase-like protein
VDGSAAFDEAEIRVAERGLVAALESSEPTDWVYEYTEDAVFDAGGDHVVEGRDALLAMARAMDPLSSVVIHPLRTEGHGSLAVVWCTGSWVSGRAPQTTTVEVRAVIVWRREADGRWRVALEHMS